MNFASASLDATVPFPAPSLESTFRPARALIGWMDAEQAHLALSQGHDGGVTPAVTDRAIRARRAAQTAHSQDEAEASISFEIEGCAGHLAAIRPIIEADIANGWRLATIDLSRVVASQPVTFTDHYLDETFDLEPDADTTAIVQITLPLPHPPKPIVQADANGRSWLISSANPHFTVVEPTQDPANGGFGFRVACPVSVLKIGVIGSRAICLDGHHRIFQLLRRGITHAPGLVRAFGSFSEVPQLPPGLLPEDVLCGPVPPLVRDLLDEAVSAAVLAPATRKYLLIEARELLLPV